MADNNFHCQLCDCTLHSKNEFAQHCKGKKHKSNEQIAHEHDVANRRLFVRGHEGINNPMMFLHTYFFKFGRVENISFGGKHGSGYAVVEFSDPASVARALSVRHRIGALSLYVKQYQHRPNSWQMSRHVHQELEQDEKTKQARAKDDMKDILLLASSVADQINLVAQNSKLDAADLNARAQISAELTKLFAQHFENCTIYQFGSSVNGFGAKGCDLDLFLDLKNQNVSSTVSKSKVNKLGQIISASPHFTKTLTIPSHRCPVVRFAHKSTEIKCDLSINNRKALHNSYLLRLYSSEPRVHKLVSLVRLWARCLELSGSAGGAHLFTSYSITLIVLFFVMRREPKMVPLVCDIEKCIQGTRREMVDDWECISVPPDAQLPPSENKETDLDLVKEFFTFYSSSVDWDRDALVMRDATIFPRSNISLDPNYIGCKAAFMTLLDPFVLTHNVVGNVNAKTKERFVAELKRAEELCSKWPADLPTPGPQTWGIAALLVPAQLANIPSKKSGLKANKAAANSQNEVKGDPAKNSATRIEGEQENGDFCLTVQPQAQTMVCAELLSSARRNNVTPAEQWCIMAQDLIVEILETVFMVEVEEVDEQEEDVDAKEEDVNEKKEEDVDVKEAGVDKKEEDVEKKEECCPNIDLTRPSGDEHMREGGSRDHSFIPKNEICGNLVKDCECGDDICQNMKIECAVHEGSSGKRTSDAAHLDGIMVESMDDSTPDSSSLLEAKVLNPKKRFCEGVVGNAAEAMADNQVIDKSESINNSVIIKNVDGEHNSVCSAEILDDSRILVNNQYSNAVSDDSKDPTIKSCAPIEALPTSRAAGSLSAVTNPSSQEQLGSTSHSSALSEIKTLKVASYSCRCVHQLWIGRKRMTAEMSNKHTLTPLELEQEISNLALRKQSELIPRQEPPKVPTSAADPCHSSAQNSINNVQKLQQPTVEFSCQIFHQSFDTDLGLPHILIKLRPAESSSNQFKNFYFSFRSLVLKLFMKHFLEVYK